MSESVSDAVEQRVDAALKAAYRDGPEWMEVRAAIEALKADRRACLQASPSVLLDQLAESVGREAGRAAEAIGKETEKAAGRAKTLATEVQGALNRFFEPKA